MLHFLTIERLLLAFVLLAIAHLLWMNYRSRLRSWVKTHKTRLPRRWQPKSPHDCPACCSNVQLLQPAERQVQPWAQRKSTRGRKKSVSTHGFACHNRHCDYFGIRDQAIHALVADGKRGQLQRIQYFKCQCCGQSFTSRKGTPLYYLKLPTKRLEFVLWFLAEGVDISVLVRYTGYANATLNRWLMRTGQHCTILHDHVFRDLSFDLIQLDELYARVRNTNKSRWIWLAIDPISKILPALHIGGRKAHDAYALLHDLHLRLHAHSVPAFTSDGLRSYFFAITAHFGRWHLPHRARVPRWAVHPALLYGQLIKRKHNRKLVSTIARMLCGKRSQLNIALAAHGFASIIQTAFIERVNLTIRQSVSLLTRKTWSYAKSDHHLVLHVQWWRAYYHFIRPHDSLTITLAGQRRSRTPAMALGLTDHVWSVSDILTYPFFQESPPPTAA